MIRYWIENIILNVIKAHLTRNREHFPRYTIRIIISLKFIAK